MSSKSSWSDEILGDDERLTETYKDILTDDERLNKIFLEIMNDDDAYDEVIEKKMKEEEEKEELQTTTLTIDGKEVEVEIIAITELDGKEYAVYTYNNANGMCDVGAGYVIQNAEGYDEIIDIEDPLDEHKIKKWFIDVIEEDGETTAEDYLYGKESSVKTKTTDTAPQHTTTETKKQYIDDGVEPIFSKEIATAAEKGDLKSQYQLGKYYFKHLKDYSLYTAFAYYWLKKASERGHANATATLSILIQSDNSIASNLKAWDLLCQGFSAESANKSELSFRSYKEAAEANCIPAMNALANCYSNGYGCQRDYSRMIEWYTKAANLGFTSSMVSLAYCYWDGTGVSQNDSMTRYWGQKAYDAGDIMGACILGTYYLIAEKNLEKAKKYSYEAALKEIPEAMFNYGIALEDSGQTSEARRYYRKAADCGYYWAKIMMLDNCEGAYFALVDYIGPVVKALADDDCISPDRDWILVEAVTESGDIYSKNLPYLSTYVMLFDCDTEYQADHYRRLMTYHKPYIQHKLEFVHYVDKYAPISEYRIRMPELLPIPVKCTNDYEYESFFKTLAEALRLYLGEGYKVLPEKRRLRVIK